ncbi:hypothetical protein QKW35_09095 [Pontibacterium granulatum]|uniref:hypothetical protein n=1 Tax=Pontibacterium granulatum TaxID=2036029 RepID=UPI00249CBAE4|nr:hypothetical protein [Pontibacterium granulatum]MDI3324530.1 hypothetical protein [Pontibacterium granulatum]
MWRQALLEVLDKLSSKKSFKEYLKDYSITHSLDIRPEKLVGIRKELVQAAQAMDTNRLLELSAEVEAFKTEIEPATKSYLEDVLVLGRVSKQVEEVRVCQNKGIELHVKQLSDDDERSNRLQMLDAENARLEEKVTDLCGLLHKERSHNLTLKRTFELDNEEKGLSVQSPLYRALSENVTLLDVLEVLDQLFPGTVVVLDSAMESAAESSYQNVRKVIDMLLKLCGPYYQAIVVDGCPDTTAKDILGASYRAQESETTLSIAKLRAQREFKFDGKDVLFKQHLTLGVRRDERSCIHVYFKIIDRKMVIAYVGKHLETSSS